MARIAKSLDTLRAQINKAYPDRSKLSDGWIGDTAHAARASDHNPNAAGVVTALDLTHDPAHGFDSWKFAEALRQIKDPRIKYVISNGRIFSSEVSPWQWRKYTGSNAHAHHVHISVKVAPELYDLDSPWKLAGGSTPAIAPKPKLPAGVTGDMRQRMMKKIMEYEGEIPPKVHIAPDGRPEIAGITQLNHPQKYAELKKLLDAGNTTALMNAVVAYYLEYTAPAQNWTNSAGLEFFLRDCILNRGPTGAAEILQMAMGVEIDHQVGPTTRGALASHDIDAALIKLRTAREKYEDKKYPQRRGSNQWTGMVNRWNKALVDARAFQKEQGALPIKETVALGFGIFAALWGWLQANPILALIIAAAVVAGGNALVMYLRKEK